FSVSVYLQSATVFKLTNAVCESFNKSWVEFELCRLRAVSRHKVYLNLNVTLHQPINDIHIKGQLMKKENGYKPWLYSVSFNGCQFIRRRNNPLIKLVWDLFKEYSTLNHTCPYVGQQYLRGFYPVIDKLRLPLPTGDYLLLMTWKFYNRIQLETNVYFTFVEDFL
ncbi:hypothetical protein KR215_000982, partial [Drosophila sulfurigaster]